MADEKKSKGGKVGKAEAKSGKAGGNVSFDVVAGRPVAVKDRPRFALHYEEKVRPVLMEKFGYTSVMQAPRFVKIVINMGVGDAIQNIKVLDVAVDELTAIAGQKAVVRKAKKSVAQFKLRAGMPIACMVTLRGPRMWEFLDRLVTLSLPRVRDFRGVPTKSFDGRGNYTLGLKDQLIFQEIDYSKVEKIKGMNITFVTSAPTDPEARALLAHLGMPFRK
jgi:large subunit ribosomal protein L5